MKEHSYITTTWKIGEKTRKEATSTFRQPSGATSTKKRHRGLHWKLEADCEREWEAGVASDDDVQGERRYFALIARPI